MKSYRDNVIDLTFFGTTANDAMLWMMVGMCFSIMLAYCSCVLTSTRGRDALSAYSKHSHVSVGVGPIPTTVCNKEVQA